MTKKVLVWLSWWVDSAVTAYLLKEQWYDVTAWFMINYLAPEWEYCPTLDDLKVAREVAEYLQIPFFTFNYIETYAQKVLDYMYEWYKKWITPNPDIMCNSEVKFKAFLDEALEAWFDFVATWHYARIIKSTPPASLPPQLRGAEGEIFHLLKWLDPNKDQSYFLAWLNQFQLSHSLFPIWHLQKPEVREIAIKAWLPNALRKDSQWICFVWKVDFKEFLEKKIDHKPWNIIDTSWKILWQHPWVFYYTIGQRKWLDIWGLKEPIFVIKKDLDKNEIIVWTEADLALYNDKLIIKNMHFLAWEVNFPLQATAKIRYRQEEQSCRIEKKENDIYEITFDVEQRAITPWQICAIYIEDELVMSWVIV